MNKEKISVLISGIAGSGKSFIAKHLASIGIEAYDIEDDGEMFKMYRLDTREVFRNYQQKNYSSQTNLVSNVTHFGNW